MLRFRLELRRMESELDILFLIRQFIQHYIRLAFFLFCRCNWQTTEVYKTSYSAFSIYIVLKMSYFWLALRYSLTFTYFILELPYKNLPSWTQFSNASQCLFKKSLKIPKAHTSIICVIQSHNTILPVKWQYTWYIMHKDSNIIYKKG